MEDATPIPSLEALVSKLPRRARGYDRAATEKVLATLAVSYEQLWVEREALRDRAAELESELEHLRDQESLLRDVLVEAHRAARTTREEAQRDADEIVAHARAEVDERLHEDRVRAEAELERIRSLANTTAADLRSFLSSAIAELTASEAASGSNGRTAERDADAIVETLG